MTVDFLIVTTRGNQKIVVLPSWGFISMIWLLFNFLDIHLIPCLSFYRSKEYEKCSSNKVNQSSQKVSPFPCFKIVLKKRIDPYEYWFWLLILVKLQLKRSDKFQSSNVWIIINKMQCFTFPSMIKDTTVGAKNPVALATTLENARILPA